ncbi:MAG: molecular chaperone TorD family protein [Candidatus Rokubacteria bacterium]|nr:molecular chaperone TorD family protein [Candidatus Rokubacteria bacterium]
MSGGGDVAGTLRRAGVYRILGGAFAYPTRERIADLARAAATLAVSASPGALRDALACFSAAAYRTDADVAGTEYVFLFDRQVRCPAYEGAWGDGAAMAGRVARLADIAGFYRAFGIEVAGAQPESEDHLVAELEFMSMAALKEAAALDAGPPEHAEITRDAQTKFVTDHLGRWAPAFAEELAGASALPYYATAAALLSAWMHLEVAELGAAPDAIPGRSGLDPVQADAFACPMAPAAVEDDEAAPTV